MTDDDQSRAAALTAWYMMKLGLDGTTPEINPDHRTVLEAAGFAAGQALTWMRNWRRLALACDLTDEKLAEIDAAEPLVALADTYIRQYINDQIAALLQPVGLGVPAPAEPAQRAPVDEDAGGDLETRGRSPQFKLAAWDFLAAFQNGTARPAEYDHHVALWLAGMFGNLWVQYLRLKQGVSEEQAEAAYAEFIEGQRAIYGGLANMDAGSDCGP